jgi:Fe-S cluster assembly ATP-binding protein
VLTTLQEREPVLEVKNLTVSAGSRLILSDLNLAVQDGEVAALMGPNGSGKSTLSYVVAGRKDFTVESGEILLNGENILDDEPNVRAAKGLFLAFQYPIEIPGVAALTLLKSAMNSQRKHRGEAELSTPDFMKRAKASASKLGITQDTLRRALNVGFSGGEKKRTDILQMTLLEPTLVILDETDSGLDIDAIRIVADGINAMRSPACGILIITHYQRLLDHVIPDTVHVMVQGKIQRSGGKELALELEKSGYRDYVTEPTAA